jgi:hypothetical protein
MVLFANFELRLSLSLASSLFFSSWSTGALMKALSHGSSTQLKQSEFLVCDAADFAAHF